jgi:hypothetical protein
LVKEGFKILLVVWVILFRGDAKDETIRIILEFQKNFFGDFFLFEKIVLDGGRGYRVE